ncbi:MAG TPA: phytochelatin synthase family protein [Pseudomonadota bacterium]|nr:phytochelatin synthase family protein [Pseudomonadota bacterium]
MDTDSFHRRLLPKALIALHGIAGRRLVREALRASDLDGYFPLAESFHTQADPAFCALATLVIVLNSLDIDSGRLWRRYSTELLGSCRSSAVGPNTAPPKSEAAISPSHGPVGVVASPTASLGRAVTGPARTRAS